MTHPMGFTNPTPQPLPPAGGKAIFNPVRVPVHTNGMAPGYAFEPAKPGDIPVEDTYTFKALNDASTLDPVKAAWSHDYFNRIQNLRKSVGEVKRELWAIQNSRNHAARVHNRRITEEWAVAEKRFTKELAEVDTNLARVRTSRLEVLTAVAKTAAADGVLLTPGEITLASAFCLQPKSIEATAADLNLIPPSEDKPLLPSWLTWIFRLFLGYACGFGFFAISGSIELDSLDQAPLIYLLAAPFLGTAITVFSGFFVYHAFRYTKEESLRERPGVFSYLLYGLACGLLTLLVGADSVVLHEGFAQASKTTALLTTLNGGTGVPPTSFLDLLPCVILTLPYLGLSAYLGLREGRRAGLARIEAKREAEAASSMTETRNRESLPARLAALNELTLLDSEETRLIERHAALLGEREKVRLYFEKLQLEEAVDFADDQKAIIAAQVENLNGAISVYDRTVATFFKQPVPTEPPAPEEGFFARLFRRRRLVPTPRPTLHLQPEASHVA